MTTTDGPPPLTSVPTPPHDLTTEKALLGYTLTRPDTATSLCEQLPPDAFYNPTHETLWATIRDLTAAGHTPDHLTVLRQLVSAGARRPDANDLLSYRDYADLIVDPTTAVHQLRDIARLRNATAALHAAQTKLTRGDAPADPTHVQAALEQAMDALEHGITATWTNPDQPPPSTWAPVDLTPVLKGEHLDPPPTMLRRTDGQPLLYDGGVHTICGESESGKTWLTLLAVLQLIAEGDNALFIDFEDRADRVIARLLALGATPTQIRDHFAYIRPDRPLDDTGRHALTPHLPGVRLVIIDGVTEAMTLHGLDLNGNADAATFYGLLPRWIADHGPAVVLIDHVVKDKEQQGRFAIGAQHKLAGIDGAAYLVKTVEPFARGRRGIARIEVGKDRPGHVREYAHGKTVGEFTLDASAGDNVLLADLVPPAAGRSTGGAFEPTGLMEKVSRYVEANPGMSKKAIEGAMNGKATTIRLALELLVSRGHIGVKTDRNRVLHFIHKPYRADAPDDADDEQGDDE